MVLASPSDMGKRGGKQRSRQAPGRQEARKKRKAQGAAMPASPAVLAAAHDREFARMNERRPGAKRVKRGDGAADEPPRYLSETLRGVARRVARVALAPLSLARAVVDRFRKHD